MCYEYIKQQSAAGKENAEQPATTSHAVPAAEPVASREPAEKKAYERYLDKIQRLLASRKREEPTSV